MEQIDYGENRYEGTWQDKKLPIWARQCELEATMKAAGTARFKDLIKKARSKKAESNTKHGQTLLKTLIDPMAQAIRDYVDGQQPGFQKKPEAAAKILARLDYEVTALVTGKYVLDCISMQQTLNKASIRIGEALEMECRLEDFENQQRRYFRRLHKALENKRNYRHKRKVYNAKIKHFKIETETVWDKSRKLHVGKKCLELLRLSTNLVDFPLKTMGRNKTIYYVQATSKTTKKIEEFNELKEILFPEYLPMLTKPQDWKFPQKGGYLTPHARLKLVKKDSEGYMEELCNRVDEMPLVYESVNAIQRTPWKINAKVLDVVVSCWEKNNELGDLPPRNLDKFEPQKPHDIATNDIARKKYSIAYRKFCDWKANQESKIIQVVRIIRIAKVFQPEKYLYFPHQLDFRGRIYAVPMFLHPQYADYARSLLHFAEGKAIKNNDDACWLAIHGANSFGYDKVSFDDRIKWVSDNEEMIFRCAENPHDNIEWSKADKPYQFLAFCFEWREFNKGNGEYNYGYKSHLPVSIDGSCNGLQHFSAMLKDEVGGAAVNLTPKDIPADIYGEVADLVKERLTQMLNDTSQFSSSKFTKAELAQQWLQFGIDRKTVKRPVMTLPYGSRRFSHRKYIQDSITDKVDKGAALPEDWKEDLYVPSFFLANITIGAIHEVVHAARDVMAWLQKTCRVVSGLCRKVYNEKGKLVEVKVRNPETGLLEKDLLHLPINWKTPAGFYVQQAYPDTESRRVKTKMGENIIKLSLLENKYKFDSNGDKQLIIDKHKQANGISPNYVHSMDGAALMKTIVLAKNHGLDTFQCIHDAFGTYASDTPKLIQCIKKSFIEIYSTNQLERFRDEIISMIKHEEDKAKIPPLPELGNLNIEDIWESDFFFA